MYANRYCFPQKRIGLLLQATRAIAIIVVIIGLTASLLPRSQANSGLLTHSSLLQSERLLALGRPDRSIQLSNDAARRVVPSHSDKQARPQMDRDLEDSPAHDFACCFHTDFQARIAGTQAVILDFAYKSPSIVRKIAPPT